MPKLPKIKPANLIKILLRLGFVNSRQKGSHVIMRNPDGLRTVIPMHGKEIPTGTLLAILKDINLAKEDLINLL